MENEREALLEVRADLEGAAARVRRVELLFPNDLQLRRARQVLEHKSDRAGARLLDRAIADAGSESGTTADDRGDRERLDRARG